MLRFGAVIKAELERAGRGVALISRSGLDLERFGQRYSHAGISLRASREAPWAVRQLYFDCDLARPRIFDQGLAAFLIAAEEARQGWVSIVFLPPAAATALERSALDDRLALDLLGSDYSANAYAFGLRYQNCNQWVVELLASAWRPAAEAHADAGPVNGRAPAQRWLHQQGYEPTAFEVNGLIAAWAEAFVPWVHGDDHPPEERARHRYHVSMPASIEAFVQQQLPQAQRVEICHDGRQVVLRRGWTPIAEGCRPAAGDEVRPLP